MMRALSTVLLASAFLLVPSCATSQETRSLSRPEELTRGTAAAEPGAENLQYVTACIPAGGSSLTVGERGDFDLELSLGWSLQAVGRPLRWDPDVPGPVLWVSTPPESGILLHTANGSTEPDQHLLLRLGTPREEQHAITVPIGYSVKEGSRTGTYPIAIVLEAGLVTPGGEQIQDSGVVSVPVTVDTRLSTKILVLAVILVAIFLFVVEWVRVDVVGIIMMVSLPILGLLDAHLAFQGLSSNAVVAIIGVMIVSFALNRVGLVSLMIQPLLRLVGDSASRLVVLFSSVIAVISSVMQNTGAAVLFLPAIRITAADRVRTPISLVLMPIGMAAILGGTLTMIGTSPLILLNDLLPPGMRKFGLLELTPIGLALVVGGLLYLSTLGKHLLAKRPLEGPEDAELSPGDPDQFGSYGKIQGPFEISIPDDYEPGGEPQEIIEIRQRFSVNTVATASPRGVRDYAPIPGTLLSPGLSLLVFGPEEQVRSFVRDYGLSMRERPKLFRNLLNPAVAGKLEIVISPRSSLIGKTIKDIGFRETFRMNSLALQQGAHIFYRGLADVPLGAGDAILAHGTWEALEALQRLHRNFIVVSSHTDDFQKPDKARSAMVCFLGTLALMFFSSFYFQTSEVNPIPLSVCLMAGALGMVVSGVITIGEAYDSVDWRTVFLLGGLIPLGMAVQQTGTAEWLARGIVDALGSSMTPLMLLTILSVMSAAFTLVMSNVGACTLLVPLGISLAYQIGIDPRVAAIAVGLGVSNSFVLPTHQVNALYMGPGKYHTGDYIRVGGLLSVIYIVTLVAMVYLFYL